MWRLSHPASHPTCRKEDAAAKYSGGWSRSPTQPGGSCEWWRWSSPNKGIINSTALQCFCRFFFLFSSSPKLKGSSNWWRCSMPLHSVPQIPRALDKRVDSAAFHRVLCQARKKIKKSRYTVLIQVAQLINESYSALTWVDHYSWCAFKG